MPNILVICDRVPPEHSATGKIAFSIARELNCNNKVFLVCLATTKPACQEEEMVVSRCVDRYGRYQQMINSALQSQGIIKTCKKIQYHLYYKLANRIGLSSVKSHKCWLEKECEHLIDKYQIDTILSVSNPFDCHRIANCLTNKYKQLQWFAYMMDSNRHNAVSAGCREEEIKVLAKAKRIFVMPALLNDQDFLEDFENRVCVLDLPIIPVQHATEKSRKDDNIVFAYAGMFYKEIRNPELLFQLFQTLPEHYILKLYSRGCDEIIEQYKGVLGNRLQIQGFLETKELEQELCNADILINIGNTVSNQVPSKVYESMAYGKPILNLYQREDDISIQHLNMYPCCIHVPYQKDKMVEMESFVSWCENVKNIDMTYEEATQNLPEKRLKNVADKLEQIMKES